ncbi:MAG: hypothetical protein BA867_14735 [Desulfobacterales bacterium S5133MH16]|nr:MAG: hypothetical protein BA867_14735 [Desulfobacterales bacterium S5133MH16]
MGISTVVSGEFTWFPGRVWKPDLFPLFKKKFHHSRLIQDGLQAMFAFYGLALAITIGTGFIKNKSATT